MKVTNDGVTCHAHAGAGDKREDGAGGGAAHGDEMAGGAQRDVDAALLRVWPSDGHMALPSRRRAPVGSAQRRRSVREQVRHRHQDAPPHAHDPWGQHRQRRTSGNLPTTLSFISDFGQWPVGLISVADAESLIVNCRDWPSRGRVYRARRNSGRRWWHPETRKRVFRRPTLSSGGWPAASALPAKASTCTAPRRTAATPKILSEPELIIIGECHTHFSAGNRFSIAHHYVFMADDWSSH